MKSVTAVDGNFSYKVFKESTGEITKEGEQSNDILNYFFEYASKNLDYWGWYIHLGSGNSPTDLSMTTLETFIAKNNIGTHSLTTATDSPDGLYKEMSRTIVVTFNAGVATGTVREIGLGNSTKLFTRALFLDDEGVPTSLVIESDEILVITYTLNFRIPIDEETFTFNVLIDGVVTPINVTRTISTVVGNITDFIPTAASGSGYASYGASTGSNLNASTTAGEFTDSEATRYFTYDLPVNSYNSTPPVIRQVRIGRHLYTFDPYLPKDADKKWKIVFKQIITRG